MSIKLTTFKKVTFSKVSYTKMVFADYPKEKFQIENGRIKKEEITALEGRIRTHGWTNLKWCPGHPENKETRWRLYGCPPNYSGEYEDYLELVAFTLAVSGNPGEDSGEISVRENLEN